MNQTKWIQIVLLHGIVFLLNCNLLAQSNYTIQDSLILKNGIPWTFVGTDNMAVFSLPYGYSTQHSNCMDIVRECIDLRMTTDSDIESMVQSARNKGMVIILAGFWYDSDAFSGGTTPYPECQLLGANPQEDPRWNLVMNRWKEIADLPSVKNHSDVWLNIWNEPYWWDGTNGYSDDMWENDAIAMIDTIRSTGAGNIVVIEGSHTGQGHEVIINRGQIVRQGRGDVVFDIHVYNTLWNIPEADIIDRFQQLKNSGNAFIVGEFANNGTEIWEPVINACQSENISLLSWLWGQYTEPFGSSFLSYSNQHCSALSDDYNDFKQTRLIYPNPVHDFIYLKIPFHIEECSIFNFAGQMINSRFEDNVVDVSNLITGIYLLKCIDHEGTSYSFKFTKY